MADFQPQGIDRYLRPFFYRDDRRWKSAQSPGRLWECRQGEAKGQGLGRQTCEPKDTDSPHPRPSEVPSSTPSPQSIDQTQNRKPRAMSSCCLPPKPLTWPSLLSPLLGLSWLRFSLLQLCQGISGLLLLLCLSLSCLPGEVAFQAPSLEAVLSCATLGMAQKPP